jgi:hypothetical protein
VWIPGHWAWNGSQFVWSPGLYVERAPGSAIWIPGYWQQEPSGWTWIEGRWA